MAVYVNTAEALVSIPDPRQDQCTEGLGTKPLRALLKKALLQHTDNNIVPLRYDKKSLRCRYPYGNLHKGLADTTGLIYTSYWVTHSSLC